MVDTCSKASMLWQSVFVNGCVFRNMSGGRNAPFSLSAPITSKWSILPITMLCDFASCSTFSRTSLRCDMPANGHHAHFFYRRIANSGARQTFPECYLHILYQVSRHYDTANGGTLLPCLCRYLTDTSFMKMSNSGEPGLTSVNKYAAIE